jgi:hypothetical protein
MAKNKISEYSATAASNTDVANINIAEGCSPSNINNAIRGVMAHLKDFQAGNVTGNALAIASGGTNAENATDARTNLGAASSGTNSDITSLTGLTTPLSVAQGGSGAATLTGYLKGNGTSAFTAQTTPIPVADGGTGATSLTANNVLLGNGTSAVQVVAPSTSGNVLTSNGTTWVSGAVDKLSTASGAAPSYSARAWVNFNGTGTVAINESGNVSSITDEGTGLYTLNFSTAMPDANYSVVTAGMGNLSVINGGIAGAAATGPDLKTTSAVRVRYRDVGNAAQDVADCNYAIFR